MISRREFNTSLATLALMAPFMSRRAHAATSPISRLLIMATISPRREVWNLADPTSFLFSPAMAAIRDKTILFDGLPANNPSANHSSPQTLTGKDNGAAVNSFDVAVAKGLGGSYGIPNLVLGAGGQASDLSIFWQDGKVVQPISDPQTAYNLAFASSAGATSAAPGTDPARTMRQRTAILDLLSDDIKALRSEQLPSADQAKLQLHQASADQLRKRLQGQSTGGGSAGQCKPTLGALAATNPLQQNALLLQVGTQALICGVTPVVGVAFGTHQGYTATSYDATGPSFNGDTHNTFCHSYPTGTVAHETFCAMQFANAVQALAKAPSADGSGTMLDETIVLWIRDMGDGGSHNCNKMPYVMAGGGANFGYSATGKTVDVSSAVNGRTHEAFLRMLAGAMGVTNLDGFGTSATGATVAELHA